MEEIKIITEVPAKTVTKTVYSCPICGVQIAKKNEASYHYGISHSFTAKKEVAGVDGVTEVWFFTTKQNATEFWKGHSRRVNASLPKEFWTGPGWYFIQYGTVPGYGYGFVLRSLRVLIDLYNKDIEKKTTAILTLSDIVDIIS